MTSTDTTTSTAPKVHRLWTAQHIAARTLPMEMRTHVVGRLTVWGLSGVPSLVDRATLIMSELVTNAINATPEGTVAVEIKWTEEGVTIAVWDASRWRPEPDPDMPAVDLDDEKYDGLGGWGLALVKSVSNAVGYESTSDGGKWIFARIYVKRM